MPKDETKKTKLARKYVFIVSVAILFGVAIFLFKNYERNKSPQLTVNDTQISIEVAQTDEQRQSGLCCRDELPDNSGMLFIYEKEDDYRFWMKDTRIPLDIVWINTDKKIVHIEEGVEPSSYPASFGSPVPAQYVLELNAGYARLNNINVGDSVSFWHLKLVF